MIGKRRGMLLLVQVLIVTVCVSVTTVVAVSVQERLLQDRTVDRVTAVAESLAGLPAVSDALEELEAFEGSDTLDTSAATEALQPLAEIVREASGVDYIVITNARGIRLTHPTPDARGQPVSTDASRVLRGETFVGVEQGTLGLTLRAKVPVWALSSRGMAGSAGAAIIGIVSVGVLESRAAADLDEGVLQMVPWVLGSLILGILAAAAVNRVVSRRFARLEADSRELAVQRRLAVELGSQTHEFTNRLHVVYGLVESGEPREALEYIGSIVPVAALDRADVLRSVEGLRSVEALRLIDAVGLRAAVTAQAATLTARGGRLVLDVDSVALTAHVDDEQVTLTANLVGNAVDAVAPQGADGRVEVLVRADNQGFALTVSDNGPGLDSTLRTRVFERGFSTKRLEHRSEIDLPRGVGLALVREIVLRRGGVIDIGRSEAGGARFRVTVPVPLLPDTARR
ncbi:ATP-binding protein [Cryobacterium sp. Y62]|uniref:sensor histidine kinase n=1 Tax=Cryobacterium sp. Y62 TaxID=2048284 RepID=UPI000CE3C999|nr:ATP-binding protein [Cryobacterium sp. Y62]